MPALDRGALVAGAEVAGDDARRAVGEEDEDAGGRDERGARDPEAGELGRAEMADDRGVGEQEERLGDEGEEGRDRETDDLAAVAPGGWGGAGSRRLTEVLERLAPREPGQGGVSGDEGAHPVGSVRAWSRSAQPIALRLKKSGSSMFGSMTSVRSDWSRRSRAPTWLMIAARRTQSESEPAQSRRRSPSTVGWASTVSRTRCVAMSSTTSHQAPARIRLSHNGIASLSTHVR